MNSIKSHETLAVGTVTVRRKPALTYQSPVRSTAGFHPERALFTSHCATEALLPTSAPAPTPELSRRSTIARKPSRPYTTTPLLPLYHPFGTLALSLPDLDPTVFGLPAPVAVFDDPTHRPSNHQRRPATKVRDAEDPAASQPPSFTVETLIPDSEIKEKPSPRRRRAGGKRKRKEAEDGDGTYPAKRPRHPRSSGLSGTRGLSREEGSPTLSNETSPALDAGRGNLTEDKKSERRTTRSRGATARRGSTASEDTATSTSRSVTGENTATPLVEPSGERIETEELASIDNLNEGTAADVESKPERGGSADNIPALQQQEV